VAMAGVHRAIASKYWPVRGCRHECYQGRAEIQGNENKSLAKASEGGFEDSKPDFRYRSGVGDWHCFGLPVIHAGPTAKADPVLHSLWPSRLRLYTLRARLRRVTKRNTIHTNATTVPTTRKASAMSMRIEFIMMKPPLLV